MSWSIFCSSMAKEEADYFSGVQKILHNRSAYINIKSIGDIEDFGYSEKGNKIKSLRKHYLNEEQLDNAVRLIKDRVDKRRYGSAGFPLTGDVKKWTKQDFCMQAATITYVPNKKLQVAVFYRTTEVIKKFSADLVFLKDIVLSRIPDVSYNVKFNFSNLTVHPMFFPILLAHVDNPVKLLKSIEESDKKFYVGIEKWMTKYLFEGETSWVQNFSQARQVHKSMLELTDPKQLDEIKRVFK